MTFDEQLRRAFDAVTDRLRDETSRQLQTAAGELASAAGADRERAAIEARETAERDAVARIAAAADTVDTAVTAARIECRSAELAASQRLVAAVRAIEEAQSLSEILDTLVSCAGREVSRAAVLLFVQGNRFRGWRFMGFPSSFDDAQTIECGVDEAGLINEAARTGEAVSGDGSKTGAPRFAELPPGRGCFAVPIAMSGQVVAVLYGDQSAPDVAPGASGAMAVPPASRSSIWAATLEVLARHAARCLEAQTALKAGLGQPGKPSLQGARGAGQDDPHADEEAAARRYARLLVSEIKLYHEADVVAGRRERDLVTRLGGEIARARVLYEQRVPPHARQGADHFHAELVQTLANGDGTLLEARA